MFTLVILSTVKNLTYLNSFFFYFFSLSSSLSLSFPFSFFLFLSLLSSLISSDLRSSPPRSGNQSKVCMIGYEGPKCGVCERNYTKDGANKCNRCAGGDLIASQAIYGSAITFFLFSAIFLIVIYLRDDGFQCFKKGKWIWRKLLHYFCCQCCDTCCCKFCRRLSEAEHVFEARRKLQRQTMLHAKSFFDKGKRAMLIL